MNRCMAALAVAVTAAVSYGCDQPTMASSIVVDEASITGRIEGSDLVVQLPMSIGRDGADDHEYVYANVSAWLLDLSTGSYVGSAYVDGSFGPHERRTTREARFRQPGLTRAGAASLVLVWRASGRHGWHDGRRSVYDILGEAPFEVTLRAPRELTPTAEAHVRVLVRARGGAPIAGAAVSGDVIGESTGHLFDGTTDERGELSIVVGDGWTDGRLRVTASHAGDAVSVEQDIALRSASRVFMSSDKTIYQPGQDVHLRALVLDGPGRTPNSGAEARFVARDARDNVVFQKTVATDRFGVASAVVPTDTRVHEGPWSFAVEVGGETTALRLPVRRYELPRLRVELTPERPFVLAGEELRGSLRAAYRFGEPVTDADVALEARTASGAVVASLSGRTDAEGRLSFSFPTSDLPASSPAEPPPAVVLSAVVTDSAEQSEEAEASVLVAAAPHRVAAVVAETTSTDREATVFVIVSDPYGRPIRATVDVGGIVAESDGQGIAEMVLPRRWLGDTVPVAITDGAGRRTDVDLPIAPNADQGLLVVPARPTYAPGEVATIQLRADIDIERILVDVHGRDGAILSTEVDPDLDSTELALPIDPAWGGVVFVDAAGVTAGGETVTHSARILVERDDRLQFAVASSAETYAPGAEAALSVTVRDAAGQPRVASVGMTVVDEAVFTLGGEPAVTLEDAFGIDRGSLSSAVGLDASDLARLPAGPERDRLARLLLAGSAGATVTNTEESTVRAIFERAVRAAGLALLAEGRLDGVDPATVEVLDPFGVAYVLEWSGGGLRMTSAGPDERFETDDDISVLVSPTQQGGL